MMPLRSADFGVLERNWGWFLALGIGLLLLGLVALGTTLAVTVLSVMFFGMLLLVGGGLEVIHAFAARRWSGFLLQLLLGLLYLAAGGFMLTEPLAASVALTVVLGLSILATGVSRIALGVTMRGVPISRWVLVSGVLSLLLGGLILARWPASSLWVIGLFVALEMIANGCSWILLGWTSRTINSKWIPVT
jgi:uncharacterized membrane protein HdeD (DUF308 family)